MRATIPAVDLGLGGRACVVTGASGGIGSATARALAAEGASVLLVGRRHDALERVSQTCLDAFVDGARGGPRARPRAPSESRFEVVELDLTVPDAPERVIETALGSFGRLDVLVNSAGLTGARPLDELPDEAWQQQWELHVLAPMRLMRAAAPRMAERGWGRIVNVVSSAARRPSGSLDIAYSVTKAAQLSLSRAFADRFAADGVLVNAVVPGAIEGEMWLADGGLAEQLAARTGRSRSQVMEQMAARTPRRKLGSEDEVAAVIAFLCAKQAANVAGAAWTVDGGSVPTIF